MAAGRDRRALEVGQEVELAAGLVTDADISKLEDFLAKSEETSADADAFLQADIELHTLIAKIANNPILLIFMESIQQLGLASRRWTSRFPDSAGVVSPAQGGSARS